MVRCPAYGKIEDKAAADEAYIVLARLRNHILWKIHMISNECTTFIRIYYILFLCSLSSK